jgi:hypothetical protein
MPGAGLFMFCAETIAPGSKAINGAARFSLFVKTVLLDWMGELSGNTPASWAMAGIAIKTNNMISFLIIC